jgi:hypothetical protein
MEKLWAFFATSFRHVTCQDVFGSIKISMPELPAAFATVQVNWVDSSLPRRRRPGQSRAATSTLFSTMQPNLCDRRRQREILMYFRCREMSTCLGLQKLQQLVS